MRTGTYVFTGYCNCYCAFAVGDLSFTRPCSPFVGGMLPGSVALPVHESSPTWMEQSTTPTPVASPAPTTPVMFVRKSSLTPQIQSRSLISPNMRDFSLFSPTCRSQGSSSPSPRCTAEAASPSRTLLDFKALSTSPSPGASGSEWQWRSGSTSSPSPVEHSFGTPSRIGSFGNPGGFQLNGQPRRRHVLNLPCSPQTPKALDRSVVALGQLWP